LAKHGTRTEASFQPKRGFLGYQKSNGGWGFGGARGASAIGSSWGHVPGLIDPTRGFVATQREGGGEWLPGPGLQRGGVKCWHAQYFLPEGCRSFFRRKTKCQMVREGGQTREARGGSGGGVGTILFGKYFGGKFGPVWVNKKKPLWARLQEGFKKKHPTAQKICRTAGKVVKEGRVTPYRGKFWAAQLTVRGGGQRKGEKGERKE